MDTVGIIGGILEKVFSGIYTLFLAALLVFFLYRVFHYIFLKIDGMIPGAEKRRHHRKVIRVKKLQEKYPDAYKLWYGKKPAIPFFSDEELDQVLERPEFSWQEKQQMIDTERELYYQHLSEANELCLKYPNATRAILGRQSLIDEFGERIKDLFDAPTVSLSPNTISTPKESKKTEAPRVINNDFALSENDISTLLTTPESRLSGLEDQIMAEYEKRYLEICQLFPNGVNSYIEQSPKLKKNLSSVITKIDIVAHELVIKRYEQCFSEYNHFKTWEKEQNAFTDVLLNQVNDVLKGWSYDIHSSSIEGMNKRGASTTFRIKFLHFFRGNTYDNEFCSFIDSLSIDKEIESFIKSIPNLTVIAADNDQEEYDSYFNHYKSICSDGGIPFFSLSDYLSNHHCTTDSALILRIYTSRDEIDSVCQRILQVKKETKPLIVCITYAKDLSTQEINDRKREEEERKRIEQEQIERKTLSEASHTNKKNWEDIREYLRWNGVSCLYHFTDRSNIQSIKKHGGLFSWKYSEEHGISIPRAGGSELGRKLDERYNLEDYVRLSFCDDHPMAYRLKQEGYNLVLLKINVRVAWLQDTLFSDMNATDSAHHHGGTIEDLKLVDLKATKEHFVSQDSPSFKKHQAEVLVKTFIPLEYITIPGSSSSNYRILDSLSLSPSLPQKDSWTEKEVRGFTEQEINAVESNVIVASDHGRSIRFVMKNGGITYLPLTSSSTLFVGESVDLNTAKLITLGKKGEGDIYRVEAIRGRLNDD